MIAQLFERGQNLDVDPITVSDGMRFNIAGVVEIVDAQNAPASRDGDIGVKTRRVDFVPHFNSRQANLLYRRAALGATRRPANDLCGLATSAPLAA
jgi:hypothetical protein